MKIALMSDLHLLSKKPDRRKDNILETQWGKLEFIFNYCKQNEIYYFFQAGDMFDKPRDWNVLDRFIELKKKYRNLSILTIYGQHDMYQRNLGTVCNLSILDSLEFVEVRQLNMFNDFSVYGVSFEEEIPTPNKDETNFLIIHAPISNKELFPGMEYTSASLFLKKHLEYKMVLCGDIHHPFISSNKGRWIVNTGCLVRKTIADNYPVNFYVYDTEENRMKTIEIPHKPFEEIFKENFSPETKKILEEFVSEISQNTTQGMDVIKNIYNFIEENKLSQDVKDVLLQIINEEDLKNG